MVFHDVPWKGRDEQDLAKNIYQKPLVFKSNITPSTFTQEFLRRTLTIDETERLSWDQVFQMIETQEKINNSPGKSKIQFTEKNDEMISQTPTWMSKALAK